MPAASELHGVPPNRHSLGCQEAASGYTLLYFRGHALHTNSTLSMNAGGKITLLLPCIVKEQKEPGSTESRQREVINMFGDDSFKEPGSAQQS